MNPKQLLQSSAQKVSILEKTFNLKIGSVYISPTYWQAALIVILLFALVFSLARMRHMYVNWSLGKSAIAMFFWGFVLTLILEGFLLIGGRTLLTEVLGWKNAPKPISTALDIGRQKLVNVLGTSNEVPQSSAQENMSAEQVIELYNNLSPSSSLKVQEFICEP